jgi:hypothetical protein
MSRFVRSSLASLFAAAFDHLIVRSPNAMASKEERRRERQQARSRHYAGRNRNNARMSGLGMRECARRVGGEDWANFKAIDRARRGLAPLER